MNILNIDKKEKNEADVTIEITPEELSAAIGKAYLKNKNRINVPGFRKGKAPRKIIEKMYGIGIFLNDALDTLIPEVVDFAMNSKELDTVGYPKVTDIELKDDNTRAEIKVLMSLRPEIKLGKYKGLSAPKHDADVSDDDVMRQIESMRERNARLESVERPAVLGDITVIDFEGFIDGEPFEGGKSENYELELGSGRFIPGFEDKLIGMKAGEQRDIDLVFPEDYKEGLSGKPVIFKVTLHDVKEKQLPELDDDFAMDVSEFDTLDEYKADIKQKLAGDRQMMSDEAFEDALMAKLIEDIQVDLPEAMVDEYMDKSRDNFSRQISAYGMKPDQYMKMLGMDKKDFDDKMRENVEKQVKVTLALEEIAKLENIIITEEQIEEEYKRAADEYKTDIEKIKKTVSADVIEKDLRLRAASKFVADNAKPEKVKPASPKDVKEKDSKAKASKEKDSKDKPKKEKAGDTAEDKQEDKKEDKKENE